MPGHHERRGHDGRNLKDIAQNFVRNQLAGVPGASIPQPFGGPWRQIQLYVDPYKLEARQISPMDVVRALESSERDPAGRRRTDWQSRLQHLLERPVQSEVTPANIPSRCTARIRS